MEEHRGDSKTGIFVTKVCSHLKRHLLAETRDEFLQFRVIIRLDLLETVRSHR